MSPAPTAPMAEAVVATGAVREPATRCAHCADPLPPQPVLHADKAFCCQGCQSVYALLEARNLCAYYGVDPAGQGRRPQADKADTAALAYLDDADLSARLHDYRDARVAVITLAIPSMHCAACLWLLEQLPRLQPAVHAAEVNLPRRTLRVRYAADRLRLSELAALLGTLGYAPQFDLAAADQGQGRRSDPLLRRLITQLGVAGFVLGNVMLLSFPDYLDPGAVSPALERLFGLVSLALAVPLLLYAGGDYLRQAWVALRRRSFAIEQPLAAGMLAMFGVSAVEILTHTGMGYLDSLAGLIFFLLVGKYVQQHTYRALAFDRDYKAYFPLAVTVQRGGAEQRIPLFKLERGDQLIVRSGEIVAADALLESAEAYLDYAFITGESTAVVRSRGDLVYAGGRQLGGRITLRVQKPADQAALTRLWNHPGFARHEAPTSYTHTVTRLSQWFTAVTVVIAVGALLFWLPTDSVRALRAFTSVLIIACPCALAFAAPFVFGHLARVFGRHGFYLKNPTVVERLARLDTLVFDKTGTLSTPAGVVWQPTASDLSPTERAAVMATLQQSAHPLASRIVAAMAWPDGQVPTGVSETAGHGVTATAYDLQVAVGRADFVGAPRLAQPDPGAVHVSIGGSYRGYFSVGQTARPEAEATLARLDDYELHLLSGDSPRSDWDAHFAPERRCFTATPEAKLDYVARLQHSGRRVAMIGDGLNDAGALSRADAGIALTAEATSFAPAADVLLAARALPLLPRFLRLARQSLTLVKLCFAVSLVYNLVGTFFAVQGLLSPVVAAVLMPFSSIGTIVLSTVLAYVATRHSGLWPVASAHYPEQNQVLG